MSTWGRSLDEWSGVRAHRRSCDSPSRVRPRAVGLERRRAREVLTGTGGADRGERRDLVPVVLRAEYRLTGDEDDDRRRDEYSASRTVRVAAGQDAVPPHEDERRRSRPCGSATTPDP